MARSTYHDQFHKLVDKGYLVPSHGNTYEFYEVPQSATQLSQAMTEDGQAFENCPSNDTAIDQHGNAVLAEDIEINNRIDTPNNRIYTSNTEVEGEIQKPKVREIHIPVPVAEGKRRPKPREQQKEGFVF